MWRENKDALIKFLHAAHQGNYLYQSTTSGDSTIAQSVSIPLSFLPAKTVTVSPSVETDMNIVTGDSLDLSDVGANDNVISIPLSFLRGKNESKITQEENIGQNNGSVSVPITVVGGEQPLLPAVSNITRNSSIAETDSISESQGLIAHLPNLEGNETQIENGGTGDSHSNSVLVPLDFLSLFKPKLPNGDTKISVDVSISETKISSSFSGEIHRNDTPTDVAQANSTLLTESDNTLSIPLPFLFNPGHRNIEDDAFIPIKHNSGDMGDTEHSTA